MSENVHAGHRKRMRNRFIEEGPDSFEDHELLELLLFGIISQGNTNVMAHKLLNKYGSLSNVMSTHPKDLQLNQGIGEGVAVFLSAINELARRYNQTREEKKLEFTTSAAAGEYCIQLLSHLTQERYYVICMDSGNRLIHAALINEGTVDRVIVHPRKVVEVALQHKAAAVILTHNHPGGQKYPSQEDLDSTCSIVNALNALDIPVSDHFIVTHNDYYSFVEHGVLENEIGGAAVEEETNKNNQKKTK